MRPSDRLRRDLGGGDGPKSVGDCCCAEGEVGVPGGEVGSIMVDEVRLSRFLR